MHVPKEKSQKDTLEETLGAEITEATGEKSRKEVHLLLLDVEKLGDLKLNFLGLKMGSESLGDAMSEEEYDTPTLKKNAGR